MRKLELNLDDETFQYLEVLAVGLNVERYPDERENEEIVNGIDKDKDDFGPLVSRLLENIADSLAVGVQRPGSWEYGCLYSLTRWNDTVCSNMFGPLVDIETKIIDENNS